VGVNYVWTFGGDHKDGVGNLAEQLGIENGNDRGPGLMALLSPEWFIGSANTPTAYLFADTVIQLEDGLIITRGRHILHTGFQYWRQRINTFLAGDAGVAGILFVYDNRFAGGGDSPDGLDLKTLKVAMFGLNGHFPDILWDGYRDEKNLVKGMPPAEERICIRNGGVVVLNADGPHKYKNPSTDAAYYQCELAKLPAIELRSGT
jgi:hypothetical protein